MTSAFDAIGWACIGSLLTFGLMAFHGRIDRRQQAKARRLAQAARAEQEVAERAETVAFWAAVVRDLVAQHAAMAAMLAEDVGPVDVRAAERRIARATPRKADRPGRMPAAAAGDEVGT